MFKIILLTFSFISFSFACSGDCISCHPNLVKEGKLDSDHQILKECITCHKVTSDDLNKMGSLCGQDCWDCHSVEKTQKVVNPSHSSLSLCIDCHKKLNKEEFIPLESFLNEKLNKEKITPLNEFLNQELLF